MAALSVVLEQSVEDVWLNALEDSDHLDSPATSNFKDYVAEQWVQGDKQLLNHFDNNGPYHQLLARKRMNTQDNLMINDLMGLDADYVHSKRTPYWKV